MNHLSIHFIPASLWIAAFGTAVASLYFERHIQFDHGTPIGEIAQKSGSVQIKAFDEPIWMYAHPKQKIYHRNIVATGEGSNAELAFSDGNRLSLAPASLIILDTGNEHNTQDLVVTLVKGTVAVAKEEFKQQTSIRKSTTPKITQREIPKSNLVISINKKKITLSEELVTTIVKSDNPAVKPIVQERNDFLEAAKELAKTPLSTLAIAPVNQEEPQIEPPITVLPQSTMKIVEEAKKLEQVIQEKNDAFLNKSGEKNDAITPIEAPVTALAEPIKLPPASQPVIYARPRPAIIGLDHNECYWAQGTFSPSDDDDDQIIPALPFAIADMTPEGTKKHPGLSLFALLTREDSTHPIVFPALSSESVTPISVPSGNLAQLATEPSLDKRQRYLRRITLRAKAKVENSEYLSESATNVALCAWSDQGDRLLSLRWQRGSPTTQSERWFKESPLPWVTTPDDKQFIGKKDFLAQDLSEILRHASAFSIDVIPTFPDTMTFAVRDNKIIAASAGLSENSQDINWFSNITNSDFVFQGPQDAMIPLTDLLNKKRREKIQKKCPDGLYSLSGRQLFKIDWRLIDARLDVMQLLAQKSDGFFCEKILIIHNKN